MAARARNATAKNPSGSQVLSEKTQKALKAILLCISKREQQLEILRQFLCANENFEPYSAFCRLDRNEDGFVVPMDLVNFMRENGVMGMTEADFYYVIKFFDSDEDGKLNYPDFLQIVLPCTNPKIRAMTTQRSMGDCRPSDFLTLDVEQDLSRLLKMEATLHSESEDLKERFESHMDYTPAGAYAAIDNSSLGFIDTKGIDNFFKRLFTKGFTLEDVMAIIRRLDLDGDRKLKPEEFLKGIKAQQPFSKMLIRIALKREEDFGTMHDSKAIKTKEKAVNLKAQKAHCEAQNNMFNNRQKLDRDFEDVSGVSPMRLRHKTDLYGLRDGCGYFNPIMVENINRLPEPEDYEDPVLLKQQKMSAEKKAMKSPLKQSQKPNTEKKAAAASDNKSTTTKAEKPKAAKSKLVLSNQGGPAKRDFS
jgi:Ca2+-binding EF-hand superfamily protein